MSCSHPQQEIYMGCVSTKGQHHISLSLSVPDLFLIAGFVALALILDNIDWYSIKVQAQTFEAYASVRMIQHSLGFRLTKKKKNLYHQVWSRCPLVGPVWSWIF